MDLPRLLFGIDFHFFSDASNVYVLLNMFRMCEANCYYSLRCI